MFGWLAQLSHDASAHAKIWLHPGSTHVAISAIVRRLGPAEAG